MTQDTHVPEPIIYAIGDIHGRLDFLNALLKGIEEDAAGRAYRLVFIGDYIDRGPDSKGVIDRLIELKNTPSQFPPVFLVGNHDDKANRFLNDKKNGIFSRNFNEHGFRGWLHFGGDETLRSYGVSVPHEDQKRGRLLCLRFNMAVSKAHKDFFAGLRAVFETETHFFCHASVKFDRALDSQDVQVLIGKINNPDFLEDDRMAAKIIVHGHTPSRDQRAVVKPNRICVDTGSGYVNGNLTACVLAPGEGPRFLGTVDSRAPV